MAKVYEVKNSIVFENNYTEITISNKTALVEKIIDKKTGKDIKGEDTRFFSLWTKENEIELKGLSLKGNIITVEAENGSFDIEVIALDNYFTFEVKSALPEGTFRIFMAHAKYSYDYADKNNTGAVGVALTIWANPVYYPDAKSLETQAIVYKHLGDIEAKYALIIAPIVDHRDILKEACLTIDKTKGIVSSTGGAWGRDSRLNFSNYIIQVNTSKKFLDENLEFFKSIGVDQIDFHQGNYSFRQGDFMHFNYKDGAEFKKNVTDVLEANGISAGLHSYSFYVRWDCDAILSKPENLRQLKIMGEYTLAEDVSADATFFPTVESTDKIPKDRGFCQVNSPIIIVDDEVMEFEIEKDGVTATSRGYAGTKAVPHKKGAKIKHVEGMYCGLAPIFGSDLFYQVARNTAKAYNEGGFKMIYLDAFDGMFVHCHPDHERWFYMAAFIKELLLYCDNDPILESTTFHPSIWAGRGRIGAWDTPYRAFRGWNNLHAENNQSFIDRYCAPTMGWYDYYPTTDKYPGNEHTKYEHTDAIDHFGTLSIAYDFSTAFDIYPHIYKKSAGLRRNIALYKKYDDLRKAQYFSEEYRQKLLDSPFEHKLIEKRGGKFTFVEKDYQIAKLYDLNDTDRNYGEFKNPFGAQMPFIRIEAMLSTAFKNPMVMFKLDENKDLTSQNLLCKYGCEIDFSDNLAKVVKVKGNGIKGGKIAIKQRCATNSEPGYSEYIIDTDFKGWREFILLEADNGERNDHGFDKKENYYAVYRSGFNNDRVVSVEIETEGDMTGVRMSSIIAYEHTYEVLKNPTVKIGDESIMFECELMASDFIEFDGKTAKVIDRYANEKEVWFTSTLKKAPRGKFKAELTARALNRCTPRAQLTLGFTGKEIK